MLDTNLTSMSFERILRIVFQLLLIGFVSNCQSLQQKIRLLDLSAGAELSDARFFCASGPIRATICKPSR